jgi:hypothetical protein
MSEESPTAADESSAAPPAVPNAARRRVRRVVLITVIATLGAVAGGGWLAMKNAGVRAKVIQWAGGAPAGTSSNVRPPGKDAWSLRQLLLADRDRALRNSDLVAAASINAALSHEALLRANAAQRAWLNLRNPKTHLLPERAPDPVWEYKDGASDCFGFMVQAAIRLEPASLAAWNQTLAAERALAPAGELCRGARADTGKPLDEDDAFRMFGSTEYVKDGLLSVYERYGDHPAGEAYRARMFEVLDVILARSAHGPPGKLLPGKGSEENGNVLQACSRLSFSASAGAAYADMAGRIADAYVDGVLPKHNFLPVRQFDFAAGKAERFGVRIRDHGNEIIPGLAEAYAMAVAKAVEGNADWKTRADRWADPIARMYETLLSKAVDGRGLLVSQMDERGFAVTAPEPNDNWAYVLNGAYLFAQASRRHAALGGGVADARAAGVEAAADRIASAVVRHYGLDWEFGRMDGLADTLESGMYVLAHRPQLAREIEPWVDDQIGLLLARQLPHGIVQGDYLDGNFIRTALLYADLRSGGWTLDSWREDVRVGFARSVAGATGSEATAVVIVQNTGSQPYEGVLKPDRPRHQQIMKLPWDWPRLNSWPERYVPGDRDEATLDDTPLSGWREGIPVRLPPGGQMVVRITVRPRG